MAHIKLNDPEVFNEFWESMAASVKLIGHTNEEKHFHNADKADLTEATKGMHSPALISMCLSTKPMDGKSHIQERVQCMIWVIAKQDGTDDSGRLTASKLAKTAAYKIIARLRKYRDDLELPGFDLSNIRMTPQFNIEPLWHGYVLEIPILVPVMVELSYREEDFN